MTYWKDFVLEEYLREITRTIHMPDGSIKQITGPKAMWISYDDLIHRYNLDSEWITNIAIKESKSKGLKEYPFEESFPNVVAYIFDQYDQTFNTYYK